jgi:hypothetical protein
MPIAGKEPKAMKAYLTLGALLLASVAGNAYLLSGGEYKQVEVTGEVTSDALLSAATPACRAQVAEVRPDATCEWRSAKKWNGTQMVTSPGWVCAGSFVPAATQTCLDDAKALIAGEGQMEP